MEQDSIERNLGTQPLDTLLTQHGLTHHDLVAAADAPLTHKTIQRARSGRRLKGPMRNRVTTAFNLALAAHRPAETHEFKPRDLFNYGSSKA